jgi:hypothetical protein
VIAKAWIYIIAHRWLWPLLLLFGAVLSVVLHNVFYGIFRFEEPVFFLMTFILLFTAVAALVYCLVRIFV